MANHMHKIVMAVTGDSLMTRGISHWKKSEQVANVIRKADVGFTNCEMLFHKLESYPMRPRWGFYAEPYMAKELAWAGIKIASFANNHACDFGSQGMFSTMRALEDAGIIHAGVGRDLDEAREPKYLETEKGRVALVASCWDPWQQRRERASKMKAGMPARPGTNMLRVDTQHIVSKESFESLMKIISEAGLNPPGGVRRSELKGEELNFLSNIFRSGDNPGTYSTINRRDREANLLSIKDAKRSADWVFVSFHSETCDSRGKEYPPDFVCRYAREAINAGADGFLGHGPHILRGIEIYKKKPIFYSLGNFIAQHYTLKKQPYDHYEFFDLDEEARPSNLREDWMGGTLSAPPSPYNEWRFSSIIGVFELTGNILTELELYPITLGLGENHPAHLGYPELAKETHAREIITRLNRLSEQWNTTISYEKGGGKVIM